MKRLTKRYQYWWDSGEGAYSLEEFDNSIELLDLISQYPSTDYYLTEKLNYLPFIDFEDKKGVRL
jgi:hypothetical protein